MGINSKIPTPPSNETLDKEGQKDYIVYTRCPKQHAVVEKVTNVAHTDESFPDSQGSTPYTKSSLNIHPDVLSDIDVPISLRKGKRSCIAHTLSPKYKSFALLVSKIQVPRNMHNVN